MSTNFEGRDPRQGSLALARAVAIAGIYVVLMACFVVAVWWVVYVVTI